MKLTKEQKAYLAGLDKSKHRKEQKRQFKLQNSFDRLNNVFESFNDKYQTDTFISATIALDRESILQMLLKNEVKIYGEIYEIPEQKLILCLLHGEYGDTKLDFKLKKSKS